MGSDGLANFNLSLGLIIAGSVVAFIFIIVMFRLLGRKDVGALSLVPAASMLGAGGCAVGWLYSLNHTVANLNKDKTYVEEHVFGIAAIVLGVVALYFIVSFLTGWTLCGKRN